MLITSTIPILGKTRDDHRQKPALYKRYDYGYDKILLCTSTEPIIPGGRSPCLFKGMSIGTRRNCSMKKSIFKNWRLFPFTVLLIPISKNVGPRFVTNECRSERFEVC
jgi:hypothetical protein